MRFSRKVQTSLKVVKLTAPLARQERFDGGAPLNKFRAIAPATIGRIGKCDASRVARVPCVFGHSYLLCGGLGREGRKRRAAHLSVSSILSDLCSFRLPQPKVPEASYRDGEDHVRARLQCGSDRSAVIDFIGRVPLELLCATSWMASNQSVLVDARHQIRVCSALVW